MTNVDDQILIPLTTLQARILGNQNVNSISVSVLDPTAMTQTQAEITAVLLNSHRITDVSKQDFTVLNQADAVQTLNQVTQIFTLLLGGIAAISLLVGGIGVMNIMLVSVTERTREIGIRKAIGAKRRTILLQFLIEAAAICLIGGAIALGIAWPLTLVMREYMPATLSVAVVSLALMVSLVTGVVSGFVPAWHAARMNPVDALRSGE